MTGGPSLSKITISRRVVKFSSLEGEFVEEKLDPHWRNKWQLLRTGRESSHGLTTFAYSLKITRLGVSRMRISFSCKNHRYALILIWSVYSRHGLSLPLSSLRRFAYYLMHFPWRTSQSGRAKSHLCTCPIQSTCLSTLCCYECSYERLFIVYDYKLHEKILRLMHEFSVQSWSSFKDASW